MLSKLTMTVKPTKEDYILTVRNASLTHGVLMELIDENYAARMHEDGLRPYSQRLYRDKKNTYWQICALTEEADENIIDKLKTVDNFCIKNKALEVNIISKDYETLDEKKLVKDFYNADSLPKIKIRFITPCAFKQNGTYTFYPDIRCIYQSLMNRWNYLSDNEVMADADLLDELTRATKITEYNLRSTGFCLERVVVPSFVGDIIISIRGTQTLINFANMLLRFGEYAGIGIKTSIGMGMIECSAIGRKEHDR